MKEASFEAVLLIKNADFGKNQRLCVDDGTEVGVFSYLKLSNYLLAFSQASNRPLM